MNAIARIGWIEHSGEQPVADGVYVEVRDNRDIDRRGQAQMFRWHTREGHDNIVAYRLLEAADIIKPG